MAKIHYRQELIGGGTTALDEIDGDLLSDGDAAWVFTGTDFYCYRLDAASGAAESSPGVIAPDTNPGNKRWILQKVQGVEGEPVGTNLLWDGEEPPDGYLERDGSEISRTVYADLFAHLGTRYGVGDGTTTFNLPDDLGEFIRIWDHGAGNDPDAASRTDRGDGTAGDHVGTKQAGDIEAHDHPVTLSAYNYGTTSWENSGRAGLSTSGTTSSTGGNETRPRNRNFMLCIKY